jgi:hypothetical protein
VRVLGDLGEDAAEDVGAFLTAGAVVEDLAGNQFAGLDALLLRRRGTWERCARTGRR